MPLKRCCIINCKSSSTRNEDKGVTYHKFPKDAHLCHNWTTVAHKPTTKLVSNLFVCSRHFCKRDFLKNEECKYILKSDAVPSIFPWEVKTVNIMESPQTPRNEAEPDGLIIKNDEIELPNEDTTDINTSGSSKGSEVENLDNIKKFIEAQEKDIQANIDKNVQKLHESVAKTDVKDHVKSKDMGVGNLKIDLGDFEQLVEKVESPADNVEKLAQNFDDETMEVASSVMEMILSETEANVIKSNTIKAIPKQAINPGNSSMPLSVGSKVEAKDFSEEWYAAEIAEVDFDEMEVLVHYEIPFKKSDEWISVSSPRLRPFTGTSVPKPEEKPTELIKLLKDVNEDPKDIKMEEKTKEYVVGERCLARWRDNRRFVATIDQDLRDGKFGVIFDDGYHWSCPVSRLSKLKDTRDVLTIDTTLPSTSGAPSPILQGGPSSGSPIPVPTFHTHLFDPTRDYLGSKSERREKKRKLNIKEIFNIGQKKQKVKVEKDKVPKEKKAVKKLVKQKVIKLEDNSVKLRTPDAVASIIGSAVIENTKIEIKEEAMEVDDFDGMQHPDESTDSKSDIDPVDEEDKLERFDKPDPIMHEEVMDKMKEVISKLEGGLKQEVNLTNAVRIDSPKSVLCSRPFTDTQITVTDTQEPGTNTNVVSPPNQLSVETAVPDVETPMPDIKTTVDEPIEVDIETATTDFEVLVADLPSPSLIDTPEAEFEQNFVPDDDTTKSDIEMGNESPRLDIDSQPILVDIDAPLDDDPPESIMPQEEVLVKKPKKLRIKDFEKPKKKIKREQKKKLLHEKWAEVDQVKNELAEMKQRMKEMLREIEREKQATEGVPLPESCLLPNEWACRWVNGQPVGKVSEIEADSKPDPSGKPALPRRSVEVIDKRLPPGWSKHMVRRSVGHSAGKWDVVLVSPENRRFHTKLDMRNFLETADESIKDYEHSLMDFGVHLKLSRKMGWISSTPDGVAQAPATILPADSNSLSPLVKRKTLSLKRRPTGLKLKDKVKKRPIKLKLQRKMHTYNSQLIDTEGETSSMLAANEPKQPLLPPLEDGYVWVGSLKVQVLENLLRCPAEGCFKNFRNNTLLQMHIKHYHRELRKMMGATPKVLDLAAARSKPTLAALNRNERRGFKVKTNRPAKREEPKYDNLYLDEDIKLDVSHTSPTKDEMMPKIPRSQDSPKLRNMLINKPVKRPRVLLPVRRSEPEQPLPDFTTDDDDDAESTVPPSDVLDFETAISTHTVTKPLDKKKKGEKKQKSFASFAKNVSEDEEWFAMNSDELDTRSSFPRSGTPDDSKVVDPKTGMILSSDPMDDQLDPSLYTFTDSGERIKIVHMKREEIINCHCGFREEDGLMVQCELCLCWQHALCHNIQRESEVPEKYTCSICLNPRRGRRSRRFVHDQDRLYEGLVTGARPDDALRRTHELSGNLLRVQDALHALRLKHYVTTKKDHPKLYLWAKDWEQTEVPFKLNSDYSDLNIIINGMDKENLPMKPDDPHLLDMRAVTEDDPDSDRFSQRDAQLGSQALLSGLLSSPSAASLDLPISTSELERLAKTVQEAAEWQGQGQAAAPQPEAAIDNDVCRERLLKHIQRCQQLIDSRLDSIEAQVAELESQDPSFGVHYETAESYPRTKQTVQMLMRDLDTMEELGVIT